MRNAHPPTTAEKCVGSLTTGGTEPGAQPVCIQCGGESDDPRICWPCFRKYELSNVQRDRREAANE